MIEIADHSFNTKTEHLSHWFPVRHRRIWSILFRFSAKPTWTNARLSLVGSSRSHFCDFGIFKKMISLKMLFWPHQNACINHAGDPGNNKSKIIDFRWGFTLSIGHISWHINNLFVIYIIFTSQIVINNKSKIIDFRWSFTLSIGHISWHTNNLFVIYIIFTSQIAIIFCYFC